MTTATKQPTSIIALLNEPLGAGSFRCKAAAPPWALDEAPRPVEPLPPPRLDKAELARQLGMSVRWVEQKMKAGLPHERIDGRVRFELAASERWLREHGHLKAVG